MKTYFQWRCRKYIYEQILHSRKKVIDILHWPLEITQIRRFWERYFQSKIFQFYSFSPWMIVALQKMCYIEVYNTSDNDCTWTIITWVPFFLFSSSMLFIDCFLQKKEKKKNPFSRLTDWWRNFYLTPGIRDSFLVFFACFIRDWNPLNGTKKIRRLKRTLHMHLIAKHNSDLYQRDIPNWTRNSCTFHVVLNNSR